MRALAATAVLAAPALAMDQLTEARAQRFRQLDKNHDGVLTLEEYGGHPGNLHAMDANGDGVLSFDEFVNRYRGGNENAPRQAPAPPLTSEVPLGGAPDAFAAMDRNGDGRLTPYEYEGTWGTTPGAYEEFRRLDRSGDGVISRREWNG
jgi:Ca2+-binding EF-hand superfamily protein